ncbi:MAG: hydroxymethylglutaryl-CoA synthase [Bacteroidia bacterium]|jgi:hydroxymethylglutaryl-CoA synthase|nr:hydroxymethylglutaryl-CoA synthase [Bacteroidia bacterium]
MNDTFGIHDLALKAPSLYLPIEDLANARDIEPAKLIHGLGLRNMSVCDVDEDVVTLAAGSVIQLLEQNPNVKPQDIGRIYVGTESSIDGSKPIGTYIHNIVHQYFTTKKINDSGINHIDVIDMTFACIGAVDAMHNSLYYLYANPDKVAIVVAADIANYDLASPGEYTQGAGAVAMLLAKNPALVSLSEKWGVSVKNEHDFFKPIRYQKINNQMVEIHDEKPIFDGQLSNAVYQDRITEAWEHFKEEELLNNYDHLIFHLPYAYHGRRIVAPLLQQELKDTGSFDTICSKNALDTEDEQIGKLFSKSKYYKDWVQSKVAAGDNLSSDMGNLYTASIFLSLVSFCASAGNLRDSKLLFLAYGSGSKAKVFSGKVQAGYHRKTALWQTEKHLVNRTKIKFEQYISLRNKEITRPLSHQNTVLQKSSGITPTNKFERTYALKT